MSLRVSGACHVLIGDLSWLDLVGNRMISVDVIRVEDRKKLCTCELRLVWDLGDGLHLGKTLAVLVVLVPWVAVFTWGCLFVTDKIMSLRVSGASCDQSSGLQLSWQLNHCCCDSKNTD
jgi:hypothetical protein